VNHLASPSFNFERAVLRLDLGEPTLSRIARGVCRIYVVWPSRLFDANVQEDRTVMARHVAWRLAYLLTDFDEVTIADRMGGMLPSTIARWARSWGALADRYDDELGDGDTFWQRHVELVLGPLCDALALPVDDWPADLRTTTFRAARREAPPTREGTGSCVV
jgi:hypothetical protein